MTTFAVDMTVGDFFIAGVTHGDDFDLEVQTLASQRVVAIDGYIIAVDITDGHDLHAAVRTRGVELHAHFQGVDAFEHGAIERSHQLGAVFAVGFFRLDADFNFIASLLANQGLFQTNNDVACTVQVYQRRAASGAVDHLTGIVGQGIVDRDSLIGGDQHGNSLLQKNDEGQSLTKPAGDCDRSTDRRDGSHILDFHQDEDGHWVATLSCGHTQHLRHQPPWQNRAWVTEAQSRQARLGQPMRCGWCVQFDREKNNDKERAMPPRNILVINCGSSSLKFALINEAQERAVLRGMAERLESPEASLQWRQGDQQFQRSIAGADHRQVMTEVLPIVQQVAAGQLHGVGHRVVHGGAYFAGACLLDDTAIAAIREVAPLAPLHNPGALQGIEAAMQVFADLPNVAVVDTAFHQSLPEHAYRYALPESLYRDHGVRRYGFHGTSHRFVSRRAAELSKLPYTSSSWLVAHLGNGSSTCAVENGLSLDTSMGLTPIEGLVMGTRSGDVDPNLHSHLARHLGWSLERIDHMLNNDSGLLGLSGLSNDMRSLEQARAAGHTGATLAIEVFCYRLAKSLAGMACALKRLDGVVFTGGIGENSALIRRKACEHLALLGIRLDEAANQRCVGGVAGPIHEEGRPRVLVIPTNEERQIALDTLELISSLKTAQS